MNLLSLASGVLPEFSPVDTAAAAIAAGWPAVGIWVDPATWTAAIAAEVAAAPPMLALLSSTSKSSG